MTQTYIPRPIPAGQIVRKPDGSLTTVVSCTAAEGYDGWRLRTITRTDSGQEETFWCDELVAAYA